MTNAIKYILVKRNKRQKDLTTTQFKKQYVSKIINGEYRPSSKFIPIITKVTGVPSKFFIDEKNGKCKQLSSTELVELEEFMNTSPLIEWDDELQSMLEIPTRERQLTIDIRKLQRKIRSDILSVKEDLDSYDSALDAQESNLYFYKKLLEIRKSKAISGNEWDSLFRAFYYLIDNPAEEEIQDTSSLAYNIYTAIKKDRALKKAQQNQAILDYIALFDDIENIDNNTDY